MATLVSSGRRPPSFANTALESQVASEAPGSVNLSNAQTGNGASTNIVDRGGSVDPAIIKITTTIGATPTVTIAIEGSADGTNFFPIQYADQGSPQTLVITTFVITTAVTVHKLIPANIPVRYLRLNYTANTNVTITADCIAY